MIIVFMVFLVIVVVIVLKLLNVIPNTCKRSMLGPVPPPHESKRSCTPPGAKKDTWAVVKIMVPFLSTLNIRCGIMIGIRKGTIILTTTHMRLRQAC